MTDARMMFCDMGAVYKIQRSRKMRFWIIMTTMMLTAAAMADDLAVTVYNSNLGVVSETRRLDFEKGTHQLQFRDVPSQIDAASVRFEVVESSAKVNILEQNYAYDLVSPEKLYNRYLDQEIELLDKDGHLVNGRLLAFGGGMVTLQDETGQVRLVLLENIAEVKFPSLPEGLITRPTLFWLYNSEHKGPLTARVGYQTGGLNWSAEYVGTLDAGETRMGLSGWASITNQSGKTYPDAKLKLVAGDISRAQRVRAPMMAKGMAFEAAADQGFEEKAFFEYHLYTLPRPATLADREIKQISLFDPAEVKVEKIFTYRPDRHPTNVEVALKFMNAASSGLGMPLPAGRVRVFQADEDGALVLLGEDMIKHTPRDEEITLAIGTAFDVVAEERLMDQQRISRTVEETTYEIELRNRKDTDVKIRVEKQLYGDWEIISSSAEYLREDATTLVYELSVPANQKIVVTFRVRLVTG
jgi:hypothetical protein